jgi:uncharacterized protein YbaR (Trm112 family)
MLDKKLLAILVCPMSVKVSWNITHATATRISV